MYTIQKQFLLVLILLLFTATACKKGGSTSSNPEPTTGSLPVVSTQLIKSILKSSADCRGYIGSIGNSTITAYGVVWGTSPTPTIALATKTNLALPVVASTQYNSTLTNLTPNTTYYVRAYASNAAGTAYGTALSFTTLSTGNIYVAGYERVVSGYGIAKYWKNGVATALNSSIGDGFANDILVNGSDVFVVGKDIDGAAVWKNNTLVEKNTNQSSEARSITISGTDRFVAVSGIGIGQYNYGWIWSNNGISTTSTTLKVGPSSYNIFVEEVNVFGSDSYAAGSWDGANGAAIVWKNGVATALTQGFTKAEAHAVFVTNNDVYVVGDESKYNWNGSNSGPNYYIAKLWKNGVATNLSNGLNQAHAYSVYVNGSEVYVVGVEYSGTSNNTVTGGFNGIAKLWKNGVATNLTNGTTDAKALSVVINGTDVYVAGYESNGTNKVAKYWKNGVATNLTNGATNAEARSIFID